MKYICCPTDWLSTIFSKPFKYCGFTIIFVLIGIVLNLEKSFPLFYLFASLFLLVGIVCLFAERHYCNEIKKIHAVLLLQKCSVKANCFLTNTGTQSIAFAFIPILTVLVFGIGGCLIFGAIELTYTLIWVLLLFSIVVFVSIVGYVQYIFLAVYICKLSYPKGRYTKLEKKAANYIPANIHWIQRLTKLVHCYQTVFFSIGCIYILAFAFFCYFPSMETQRGSCWFYILWAIIFFAIVVIFPLISLLEHKWIKKIVQKLKESYIYDLERESELLKKVNITPLMPMLVSVSARQIWNSKDYPLHAPWKKGYTISISIINFVATITTIFTDTFSFIIGLGRFFL